MSRNILIFYPHNFFKEKNGINTRFLQLLQYLKSRDIRVDILALKNFKSSWENIPTDHWGLVDQLYFYDFSKGVRFQLPRNRKRNPLVWIKRHFPFGRTYTHLPNFAFPHMKKEFAKIMQKKHYDFILISYVLWADVINQDVIGESVTLLDLSDFMTLNRFDSSGGSIALGGMITEEIRRVNLFQKVLCISQEEKWFFSQFTTRPSYHYVPFFIEGNPDSNSLKKHYPYAMVFVGSDNPHNIAGLNWFLREVLPLLTIDVGLKTVGTISQHVAPHPMIHTTGSIENLDEIYLDTKMAICPLLGGTGMKSKVVEALSYGLPVVTTSKGVTGFPVKTENGCLIADTPSQFAYYITKLNTDNTFYLQQKQNACRFFIENFLPSQVYPVLDEIFMHGIEK